MTRYTSVSFSFTSSDASNWIPASQRACCVSSAKINIAAETLQDSWKRDKLLQTSSAHPVKICVSTIALLLVGFGHIIVDDDVDALDINATSDEVSRHQQPFLALLELLIGGQSA